MSIDKVTGIHATDVTMDMRFTRLMNLPKKFLIVPIRGRVEWTARNKRKTIVRGQPHYGQTFGNNRWRDNSSSRQFYRGNRGRGGWQDGGSRNYQNQTHNNNNSWKWHRRGGGIMKRQRGGQGNGNYNRNWTNRSNGSMPSKEELDKQLEEYMAGSLSALNKDLDQYMMAATDPVTLMTE